MLASVSSIVSFTAILKRVIIRNHNYLIIKHENMNKRIKNACLLMALVGGALSSCKKSETPKSDLITSVKEHSNLRGGDEKWDLMGYGYNATQDMTSIGSMSSLQVINMDKFAADYPTRIDVNTTSEGTQNFYAGATALDFLKEINKSKASGISGTSGDQGGESGTTFFSGNLKKNKDDNSSTTFSSKYGYASFESSKRIKRIRFASNVDLNLLKQYLTADFINDVNNSTAEKLVHDYGTHVLLDISLGGRYRFDYSAAVVSQSVYDKKVRGIKAGLFGGLLKVFGIDLSTDISKTEITKTLSESRNKDIQLKFIGGATSGRSIAFDSNINTSENFDIGAWESSIDLKNSAVIEIGKAVLLSDLIDDPVKKGQVLAAIEKYIKDNKPQELGEAPVYEYWSQKYTDHYYVLDNQPTVGDGSWAIQGYAFSAFATQAPGTVPIYVYMSGKYGDHYYTTTNNPTAGDGSWKNEGIAFYAYKTVGAGRVPIYEYMSGKYGDHFYTTENSPTVGDGSWVNSGIAFYVPK